MKAKVFHNAALKKKAHVNIISLSKKTIMQETILVAVYGLNFDVIT